MTVEKPELARRAIRYSDVKAIVASYGIALALTLAGVSLACAQAPSAVQKPCSELGGDPSKTLSEKLDQGSGVICPPNVDPGIKAPTPETGKMPVIPPPGSPSGDPKVQPK
ncbi:MAG: hypothetical protein WBG18_21000 [Xanthobacteraceae bacterium]